MFGYIIEKTTGLLSETYDIVADTTEYIIDDIQSIPDAISDGWEKGLSSESPVEEAKEPEAPAKKFGNAK